jgi:hypothetical protein
MRPSLWLCTGLGHEKHWQEIARDNGRLLRHNVVKSGPTMFVLALHPVAYYPKGTDKDAYWKELGKNLREKSRFS